jgi:hypothetical protein
MLGLFKEFDTELLIPLLNPIIDAIELFGKLK